MIADSYETLEDTIPAAWLPRLSELGATGKRLGASVEEYGCGVYGCVIPTVDKAVVLKLTTDVTEAEFAADFAPSLAAPICVRYHMVIKTKAKHQGNRVYLLWRDSAEHVGELAEVLGEEAAGFVRRQHRAAQDAFQAATKHPDAVARFLVAWLRTCRSMAEQTNFPDLQPLGSGLLEVWDRQHILFGDIHEGNLGMVNGRWVITDPGNIAIIEDVNLSRAQAVPPGEVILRADRLGRPDRFKISGAHVAFTGETVTHDDAVEMLRDAMPAGFAPGPDLNDRVDFAVIRGIPQPDNDNTIYLATPQDLVTKAEVFGYDMHEPARNVILEEWAQNRRLPAIGATVVPDGRIYITDGREVLQVAADSNRPVAILANSASQSWRPPIAMKDISREIAGALPEPLSSLTRFHTRASRAF